jgi:hypothetical protein
MSTSIRPMRRAAHIAKIRINQYANADAANSDSDDNSINTSNDNGLIRARLNGYDDIIFITRYLLNQCMNAKYEDEKTKIAEQLFDLINKNPNILIFEPKFRTIVQEKAKEFEEHLNYRVNTYNKNEYQKELNMIMFSMRKNIRNSTIRENIYKHITEIDNLLTEYDNWNIGQSLRSQINLINNTLQTIKNHPSYIKN